jgi:hypothetical protein
VRSPNAHWGCHSEFRDIRDSQHTTYTTIQYNSLLVLPVRTTPQHEGPPVPTPNTVRAVLVLLRCTQRTTGRETVASTVYARP